MIKTHEVITDEQKKYLCEMFEKCSEAEHQIFYVTFLKNPDFIEIFARYAPEEERTITGMNSEEFNQIIKQELDELEKLSQSE